MDRDDRTVEELIAAAGELAATSGALAATLAGVSGRAREGGVSLSVDLHCRLTGLEFDQRAMSLRADELASRITSLARRATVEAMTTGVSALADIVDGEVIESVLAHIGPGGSGEPDHASRRQSTSDDIEDYTPSSWRMSW